MAVDSFGLGDLGTPGSSNTACIAMVNVDDLEVGDIMISEVMHSPKSCGRL